ncbi:MAG: hypothetical protein R2932_17480 [Caldilineaceae bacterium]
MTSPRVWSSSIFGALSPRGALHESQTILRYTTVDELNLRLAARLYRRRAIWQLDAPPADL